MFKRAAPSSLIWLGILIAVAIVSALSAGAILALQSRQRTRTQATALTGGSVENGRKAVVRYGCGSCHVILGISGAAGKVGPDLTHIGQRAAIAGALSNDPETMARWIEHPQRLRPGTGMPEMGVTAGEARDITAYLYAQE